MVDPSLQKLPPQSIEAEESLLASCILGYSNEVINQGLTVDTFYRTAHQKIYAAIIAMSGAGIPIELASLINTIRDLNWLEEIGGAAYLSRLIDCVPASTSIEHYCNVIKEKALRRNIISRASKLMQACHDEKEINRVLEQSQGLINNDECKLLTDAGRYKLTKLSQIKLSPPRWLINEILEEDTLALIFGDSATGKSFLAIDMCSSIATGTQFCGKNVDSRPVVYIAGEGQNGIKRRFKAWSIAKKVDISKAPIYISLVPAQLCDPSFASQVISAINIISDEVGPPGLVVIDTVARNFGPGDENSTKEMGLFIHAADVIRAQYQSTILLIHHTGQMDKARARGNSSLKAALDAEYIVKKDDDGIIRLKATKMKDGDIPDPLAFKLCETTIGDTLDSQNNPVQSAVLMNIPFVDEIKEPSASELNGKWQKIALKELLDLYKTQRETLEKCDLPSGGATVTLLDWKKACVISGIPENQIWRLKKNLLKGKIIKADKYHVSIVDEDMVESLL